MFRIYRLCTAYEKKSLLETLSFQKQSFHIDLYGNECDHFFFQLLFKYSVFFIIKIDSRVRLSQTEL